MGVKYRLEYRDHHNQRCRIDIALESYLGIPIPVRGVLDQACILSWDCPDDPYEPIVNSKATINIMQGELSPIDILELQESQDRDFTVQFYIENIIKWSGFLDSAGLQRPFQSAPYDLQLTATDGLMLLEGLDYTHANLTGGRVIINYFRQILFATANLGLPLPIRWVNTLTNPEFPLQTDIFSGSVEWSPRGEGFTDYNGNYKSCMYILEGMLRSMQCRIFQDEGRWNIMRINDIVTGEYIYRQTPATLIGLDVSTSAMQYTVKTIGGNNTGFNYRFIEEDAVQRVIPGLKRVITTYEQDQRDNILPNGNMDLTSLGAILYWELTGGGTLESVPSIYDDRGEAAKVTSLNAAGKYFQLVGELPIDADVLYATMNLGFKFLPVSGFPVDANGLIIWTSGERFLYVVSYQDNDGIVWYLNEFGFWTSAFVSMIKIHVDNLKLGDVAQIDFNKFQNVPIIIPAIVPIARTAKPTIKIAFFIPAICEIIFDGVYVKVEQNNDVYRATVPTTKNSGVEEYTLKISTSHNGFYVSNFMTSYEKAGLEKYFSDSRFTGTLTAMNSHAILRNRYKSSLIMDMSIYAATWRYGEVYNIQTLTGKNFLPLKASWNTETNTSTLTLIESRNDAVTLTVEHYGKNDNIGSN